MSDSSLKAEVKTWQKQLRVQVSLLCERSGRRSGMETEKLTFLQKRKSAG